MSNFIKKNELWFLSLFSLNLVISALAFSFLPDRYFNDTVIIIYDKYHEIGWIGSYPFTMMFYSITKLKYLDWNEDSFYLSSNLGGNPLVDPPLKVCLKGIQEIRIYFQEHEIIRKPTLTQINNYNDNTEAKSRLSNVSQLSAYPD